MRRLSETVFGITPVVADAPGLDVEQARDGEGNAIDVGDSR